jgi:hypothetical protein
MRKVTFKTWVPPKYDEDQTERIPGTGVWSDFINHGFFHTWTTSPNEAASGEMYQEPIALIEDINGIIHEVATKNVKFDPYNPSTKNKDIVNILPIPKNFEKGDIISVKNGIITVTDIIIINPPHERKIIYTVKNIDGSIIKPSIEVIEPYLFEFLVEENAKLIGKNFTLFTTNPSDAPPSNEVSSQSISIPIGKIMFLDRGDIISWLRSNLIVMNILFIGPLSERTVSYNLTIKDDPNNPLSSVVPEHELLKELNFDNATIIGKDFKLF